MEGWREREIRRYVKVRSCSRIGRQFKGARTGEDKWRIGGGRKGNLMEGVRFEGT